jgi:AraC-like DNA-binding protein
MAQSRRTSPQRERRVLAVDDDARMLAVVRRALSSSCDVVQAGEAGCAVRLLSTPGPRFDVAIVVCLHFRARSCYATGVSLIRTMFRRWPWIPILAIGDRREPERLVADVLLSGVRHILRAPCRAADIAAAVRRIVGSRSSLGSGAAASLGTIRRIFGFLDERFGDNPTLGELAAMVKMSRSHFSRTFHGVAGMPLRDYIRDLRLKRAHELLLTPGLSLTAVAVESGFYDLPHFDKAFRQRIGMSPHEFRGRYAKPPIGA